MARTHPWEISDEFREPVKPLLPESRRDTEHIYKRGPGGGRKAKYSDRLYFAGIVYVLRTGIIRNAFSAGEIWRFGFLGLACPFSGMGKGGVVRGNLAEYDEMEGILPGNGSPWTARAWKRH